LQQDAATKRNTGVERLCLVQPSTPPHALTSADIDAEVEVLRKETFAVGFIALHGINGDLWGTWEHEDGTLWLRDLLPVGLPGSRVWTYGYPADVFAGMHHGTLRNNARRLLEQIVTRTEVGQALD
jgi:hypothetical protein